MNGSKAKKDRNAGAKERIRAAGEQALKEAEARRKQQRTMVERPKEIGGPAAPEPTRYGDWERKGVASDF